MKSEKIVCLYSGGLDSTTLLYQLLELGYEVYPLTIHYGQKHFKELEAARSITSALRLPYKIVNISTISSLLDKSSLIGSSEIPSGLYNQSNQSQTIVPNRNAIFLSLATAYAVNIGAKSVAFAAHGGDHPIYPDCRPEFVQKLQSATRVAIDIPDFKILAPFMQLNKTQIVNYGLQLKVPYALTWSCYKGGEKPCLTCGTCTERTEAFFENGAMDPALTTDEWDKALTFYCNSRKDSGEPR